MTSSSPPLRSIQSRVEVGVGTKVELVEGAGRFQSLLEALYAGCRSEFLALHTEAPLSAAALDRFSEHNTRLLDRGATVQIVYPVALSAHSRMWEHAELMSSIGAQIRFAESVPFRLIVADASQALLPADDRPIERAALLVRHRYTTMALRNLALASFQQGWTVEQLANEPKGPGKAPGPTDNDRRVLELMSSGLTDEAAARHLSVTDRQFRRYVAAVMVKLDAVSRFQLGVRAADRGWI